MTATAVSQPASTIRTETARDGTTLATRRWPVTGDAWGSVLLLHGLAEHSGRYERTGTLLADAGLETTALDLRGFGRSGGRRAYVDRWSVYLDDVEDRLASMRAGGGPAGPTVLLGHSFGALIALTYALDERRQPDLLVLSAPPLDSTIPKSKQLAARVLGRVLPTLELDNGLTRDQLSRDPEIGERYFGDPLVYRRSTMRLGAEALAAQRRARTSLDRLRTPTLVIHGGSDSIVPTAASAALAEVPGVRRVVYGDLHHEVFNEPEGPQVVADVVAWIRSQTGAATPGAAATAGAAPATA